MNGVFSLMARNMTILCTILVICIIIGIVKGVVKFVLSGITTVFILWLCYIGWAHHVQSPGELLDVAREALPKFPETISNVFQTFWGLLDKLWSFIEAPVKHLLDNIRKAS